MNEKALQTAYSIFKTGGYEGDINQFFNLLKTNEKARAVAFDMFSNKGYDKDINAFSSLIGLDNAYTANGSYIKDNYKEDENGRRSYFNSKTNNYDIKEVSYDYDRSKGVRFNSDTYGQYLDDFAYNFIKPTLDITVDAVRSSQSGDYTDAMNEMLINGQKGMTEEMAAKTIDLMRSQKDKAPSENIANWAKEMEAEKNKVYGFLKATWNNPAAAYEATISSVAGQLRAAGSDGELVSLALATGGATAAVGTGAGPLGTVAGFARGFMSTLGGGVESASKFGELIVEEFGGRMPTEEELINFLGNKEKFTKFRNKALAKGATIALVDNIGGSIVQNSVFKTAKTGRKVLAATKGLVGEAIVGGGGEALSSTVIGEEVSAVDVGLEILGQGGQATIDVGSALITPGKYSIKGKKATLQQVNEILNTATPEEIANIDIEIKNDPVLEAEYNKKRQKGYLQTQVDPNVSDPKDRERAADLQIEKEQLENKIKKGGIFKGVNTETKLENVNKEIDAIFNKYGPEAGPAVDPAGVEARTIVKNEAYNNRLQLLKDEITKGVKQTKFYRKANIKTKEADGDQAVDMFVKQEADNLCYDLTLLNNELSETTDAKRKNQITKKIAEVEAEIQALDENSKEAKNAHGFLLEDNASGEMTIVINTSKDISSAGNINVAAHELLHAVLRNTFLKETGLRARELKGTGIETGQGLLDYLVKNEEMQLLFPGGIIDRLKSYADGDTKGQEVLNLLSDAMVGTNYKTENQTFWQGLGDRISDILQAYLPERFTNKLNFGDGKQVFDFVKTFNKAVAGDVVSNRIIERVSRRGVDVDQRPTDEAAKTPMSKSPLEAINDLIPKTVKTQDDYYALLNDPRIAKKAGVERILDVRGNLAPVIQNYIKSRSTSSDMASENMQAVKDRLANFNPAAKREDGTTVGPEGFGEFIFANARFGKMVAAEKLAIEAVETKRTTRLDDPDVKDIAAQESLTEQTDIRQAQVRQLNNFDIELEDGLVDAEIQAEVDALIEQNPADLEARIEKLILSYIRKKLDNTIGKIAKNKETGKVEPTPEYEKFIRGEFDEIVSSLGIDEIRKSYKPWFEQTKTGTKDHKNVDPVTGVVSNYRKDTFINKANKPKYLKFFLQGKPNVLRERRTALLRRIARRKAEIAIDKHIEANSANIDAVVDAKLRQISRTAKNIQNEQISFDSVKFSKDVKREVKRYMGFKKPDGSPMFGTQGNALEQVIIDLLKSYNIPTRYLKIAVGYATEKGGLADINLEVLGEVLRIEVKLNENVPMGSVTASAYNLKTRVLALAKSSMDKSLPFDQIIEEVHDDIVNLVEVYNGKVNAYNNKNGTNEPLMDTENPTGHAMVESIYNEMVAEGVTGKIFNKSFFPSPNAQPLIDHYLNKFAGAVKAIEIFGKGLYSFVENSVLGPNVPYILNMLRVETHVRVFNSGAKDTMAGRTSNIKVMRKGKMQNDRYVRFTLQFQNKVLKNSLKTPKNPVSLTRKNDIVSNLNIPVKENLAIPFNKAISKARTTQFSKEAKGITVLDFDDTLATTESLVKYTTLDGTTGTLNAEEFASTYEDLQNQGYTFDFSDFNKVVKGKLAPLFNKAIKLQSKFGPENMFVLTARPPKSQKAIFDFLKANGLNIPLKNITGLGNSTAEAKALLMAGKVGEGYNDFYFADDALQNVQAVDNMLEQFDVKRKVQQAKVQFSKDMDSDFNNILQEVTGIETKKRFSDIKARKRGSSKGKFRFFIPPSHEDFTGLLYNFMGKGIKGDQHRNFFEQALVRPLNRAYREIDTAKQAIANDYKQLNKQFPNVKDKLKKKTPDGDFTFEDALRVYLWNKHDYDIPGLTPTDQTNLSELIMNDTELQAYAETLNVISKQDTYVDPGQGWEGGNIKTDLIDATGRVGRAEYFTEFNENADIIFSPENLNKIEAAYGADFRSALEDMLHRISTGINRPKGQSGTVNAFMNYLNGSVGTVMFFNVRSAIL